MEWKRSGTGGQLPSWRKRQAVPDRRSVRGRRTELTCRTVTLHGQEELFVGLANGGGTTASRLGDYYRYERARVDAQLWASTEFAYA